MAKVVPKFYHDHKTRKQRREASTINYIHVSNRQNPADGKYIFTRGSGITLKAEDGIKDNRRYRRAGIISSRTQKRLYKKRPIKGAV